MNLIDAVLLGMVEGISEFLPISSTGHLTIAEKLLGLSVDDAGVTAFTAIIQLGAIAAVIVFFRTDIVRIARGWFRGLTGRSSRQSLDYRLGWYVIIGSVPIGLVGFLGKDFVSGPLRNLWVVAAALVVWSAVMILAERVATQARGEQDLTAGDAIIIGVVQCLALVPGVSRSGATISAGLFRGLDRVTATRLSFLLSIPALTAAGAYEAATEATAISASVGWAPTLTATAVSAVVAYASIAWLLRLVAHHPITIFVAYRIVLGVAVALALTTGALSAN
jgi:undecaprenyl-diphosphatase